MNVRLPNLDKLFREVDNYTPLQGEGRLPLIGISSNRKDGLSCIAETYVRSVELAGGVPLLIPATTDISRLTEIVKQLDGLILTGGGDIHPFFLDEEPIPALQDVDPLRDEYDLILLRLACNRQIPVFGICRGHQLINAAFGGKLYQDISSQYDGKANKHSQLLAREYPSHTILLTRPDSKLSAIFSTFDPVQVNSFHHQAVKEVAPGFIETAVSTDGLNEGMEHPEKQILSVQWHPEAMAAAGNSQMLKLFTYRIREAALFHQAKMIHQKILTVDSHTDTPMVFPGQFNLGKKEGGKVNIPLMEEGMLDAAFMVAYIPQGDRNAAGYKTAYDLAIDRLQEIRRQETFLSDRMGIVRTEEELIRLKQTGRKGIFLGIENGYAIGKELGNLSYFKELGVTYITLCHNGDNDICDSARGTGEWGGLSPFGKEVVLEMNRLGIMIDVSHASEQTFYDVLNESRFPVIASHSSARALCDHPRNLTDQQIKAIAGKGGVVQVCLYKGFINKDEEKASLSDAIRHINHIVNLVGTDHVGIGSDFDGDGEVIGCYAANELINITIRLLQDGYSENDIKNIWGGNLLRTLSTIQQSASS